MLSLVGLGILIGVLVYTTLTAGLVKVVVANRYLAPMTIIQDTDLTLIDMPSDLLKNEYFTDKTKLIGAQVSDQTLDHTPIYRMNLMKAYKSTLTNQLDEAILHFHGKQDWVGITIPITGLNAYSKDLTTRDHVMLMQAGIPVMIDVPLVSINKSESGISSISLAVSPEEYRMLAQNTSKSAFSLALMNSNYASTQPTSTETTPVLQP